MTEATPELDGPNGPHVVLLSGLSGGGKTAAAKLFEDLAYTVVDNLPSELLPNLAELVLQDGERFARVAIVLDVRAGDAETAYRAMRGALEGRGIRPQVFFLEASDEALIRRFSETRHRHPLANGRSTQAAISLERRLLDPIRAEADVVVDTTDLPLRELSGLTEPVRDFVLAQPGAAEYLDLIDRLLEFSIPAFGDEGKSRLTVAIGCTGGRHRSIVFAEELARRLREEGHGPVEVFHRELERK